MLHSVLFSIREQMFVSSGLPVVCFVCSVVISEGVSERLTVGWALVCQSESLSLLSPSSVPPLSLLSLLGLSSHSSVSAPALSLVCVLREARQYVSEAA